VGRKRIVYLRINAIHGLYGHLGYLPADATVMQRPRPPLR
jgi:hypothetical protein